MLLFLNKNVTLRLYGVNLTSEDATIRLTSSSSECNEDLSPPFAINPDSDNSGTVVVLYDNPSKAETPVYLCYSDKSIFNSKEHQGNSTWISLMFQEGGAESLLPLPLQVCLINKCVISLRVRYPIFAPLS